MFGPDVSIDTVDYKMLSLDGGVTYRGMSLEAEYHRRWLRSFTFAGPNTASIPQIVDNGYQVQTSAMLKQNSERRQCRERTIGSGTG